ncbi:LysR family transcriptional regulator [Photobacterium satsumensis]|uniref:LysR family transcriptional regulator n=1 Tax=Photobacterium satsumensis TaxID=2910239 RepID=UPI003D0FB5CC
MDKLEAMEMFVRVAEAGSFSKAAYDRGCSPSFVSKQISFLEKQLQVKLIHRTTRSLHLTDIGMRYLDECQSVIQQLALAESKIQEAESSPSGRLRVSLPSVFGEQEIMELCSQFIAAYPNIDVDIHLDDRKVDLIEEGFDVCIRASFSHPDSNLVMKKLGTLPIRLYASKSYVEINGYPESAEELASHNFIAHAFANCNLLSFKGKSGIERVSVRQKARVNNTYFVRHLVKKGHGIAFLPEYMSQGLPELTVLLSGYTPSTLDICAMYPDRLFIPNKTRAFVAFFNEWFQQFLY